MKTKAEEKHQCPAVDTLEELCDALDPLISALLSDIGDTDSIAKNINLLVQGARAMAGLED